MKGLWATFVRELRDKRTLLIGALALAAVPWIGPFVPGLRRFDPEEVRRTFMILLGVALPPALALGLGASVLGEEVAGRRLGFYFARPLEAWAIWGGKMLVALLVPVSAAALIFTPLIILFTRGGDDVRDAHEFFGWSLALSVMLGVLAQVGAGLYRTRSPWLALDLALAALVAGGFYFVGREMLDRGAQEAFQRSTVWTAVAFVSTCLAAGFAQVAQGRSDPRRGHLALAVVLWGGLLLCLGGASAYAAWYFSPEPADLQDRVVLPLGDGDHFLYSGFSSRGRTFFAPWFAMDARDGGGRQVSANLAPAAVSPNRRHVLLTEGALSPRLVLVSAVPGQSPVVTRAALGEGHAWPLCLSDDGALVVLKGMPFAQIVETATGKVRPGPRLEADACTFEGRSRVVLYHHDPAASRLDRSTFDLTSSRSGESVHFAGADRPLALRGDRLLAHMAVMGPAQVALFELSTGRLVRSLGTMREGRSPGALLLRDGGIAVMAQGDVDNTFRLFDAEGRALWTRRAGPWGRMALVGEATTGEIVAVSWSADLEPTTLYLDGATGEVSHKLEGLSPAVGLLFFGGSDPTVEQSGPLVESRLFVDRAEALYRVDAASGRRRLLIAGASGASPPGAGF